MPDLPPWLPGRPWIGKIWTLECETTLIVFIDALSDAITNAVWTLVTFDMYDFLRSYYRPAHLRSARHGRKRGKAGKAAIPEFSDVIAGWAKADEALPKDQFFVPGEKGLWIVDGVVQRGLYYWMLVNIVEDFWSDLQWGIATSSTSSCVGVPRLHATGDDPFHAAGGWFPYGTPNYTLYEYVDGWDGFTHVPIGGKFRCILSSKAENVAPYGGPNSLDTQLRIKVNRIDGVTFFYSHNADIFPQQSVDLIATAEFEGPCFVYWECRSFGAPVHFHNGHAIVAPA